MEKKAIKNMRKIRVTTKYGEYPVFIGKSILDIFRNNVDNYDKILLVTDRNVYGHYGEKIEKALEHLPGVFVYQLQDGKTDRTLATVMRIYDYMIGKNFTPRSGVIAFGGESVCDMAGFVSATFRGGIDNIEIPASLTAMINSGTNGTFAVDHERSKNSICIAKYPAFVINDLDFLGTLPREDMASGFAEAIKCALISYKHDSRSFYYFLEKYRDELVAREPRRIQDMVDECCKIEKAAIDTKRFHWSRECFLKLGYEYAGLLELTAARSDDSYGDALAKGIIFTQEISRTLGRISEKFVADLISLFRSYGLDPIPRPIEDREFRKFIEKNPEFVVTKEDYSLDKEAIPEKILLAANESFRDGDYMHRVLKVAPRRGERKEKDRGPGRLIRKAVVDIGTNSVRLLVADVREKGETLSLEKECFRRTEVVRLGEDVNKTRQLRKEAMERTLSVLREYKKIAADHGVETVKAFATSAVRDARNREEFLSAVRAIPMDIQCITGMEEGRLDYLGNAAVFDERILVVDIGGGSTEFSLGEGGEIEVVKSIDIGAVRATEKFFRNGYTEENMIACSHWIKENLDVLFGIESLARDDYRVVAVAGTATTQIAVRDKMEVYDPEKIHLEQITLRELEENLALFLARNRGERGDIPGLLKKREDVIAAGTMILIAVLKQLVKDVVTVSESDNLVGAVLD
ncbi:MAG: iron-containing alcohol dehydrogenase [Fusobacteriaceae bacterium]|jgi:exopolyphosphatase/guanosine-5'-triphosphate,3'-diphosphate pyrophosphatase|nr:iron-containing alcohol dehydrogenase [Fusobacteriaceae bacterium]